MATQNKDRRPILVTGGTGFVGAYVCRVIAERGGAAVAMGISPFSEEALFILGAHADRVGFARCDISDPQAVFALCKELRPAAIVHSAGFVGHDRSLGDPVRTYAVNIGGAVNVLDAARQVAIDKVVLVSSNAVYGPKVYSPFDEAHPVTSLSAGNPNAHYGAAKMAAEQIGLAYHTHHGLDVTALRVTAVYGFGMRAPMFIKPMVEGAVRGEAVALPSGGPMPRDYTYIEDCAAGIMMVLEADTRGLTQRIFNMSAGALVTASAVADLVRQAVPEAAVTIADALTPTEAANVHQRAPLDSRAARKAFGFEPRFPIAEGVRDYVAVMRRYLDAQPVTSTH